MCAYVQAGRGMRSRSSKQNVVVARYESIRGLRVGNPPNSSSVFLITQIFAPAPLCRCSGVWGFCLDVTGYVSL